MKYSTLRSKTWLPSRWSRMARFVSCVIQFRRPISSSAPQGLFETLRPSCSWIASGTSSFPGATGSSLSCPRRSWRDSTTLPPHGRSARLLRRRLSVLVHGIARAGGGRRRRAGAGRMAAARAAAGAARAARASRRPPARRLDAQRVPQGARARHRDPPAALPAALDPAAGGVPVGEGAGPAARLQARPLRDVLLRGRGHRRRPGDRTSSREHRARSRRCRRRGVRPEPAPSAARDPLGGRGERHRRRADPARGGRKHALGHGRDRTAPGRRAAASRANRPATPR